MAVLLQSFDHPPCPAFSLTEKAIHRRRRSGETNGGRLKADTPTALDKSPSQHNVLSDDRWPTFMCFNNLTGKCAKSSLRNQSSLVQRLLTFSRRYPGEVI